MIPGSAARCDASEPSFGSTKVQIGSFLPVIVRIVEWYTSYCAIEIIARYVAIGRRCCQCQVVVFPCRLRAVRSPLPATSRSLGTFTATSKVALSRGALLFGNQVIAPTGSLSTVAPSLVGI